MSKPEMIKGKRVYLRPMCEADASYIVKWRNDPEIKKWMFNQQDLTIEGHLNWFHSLDFNERLDYIICDLKSDTPIGTVNFVDINQGSAEGGKMLGNKDYWGGGYAKEAFLLWLKFGFYQLKLKKIFIRTMATNQANIKLNERLGFKYVEETTLSHNENMYKILIMELSAKEYQTHNE